MNDFDQPFWKRVPLESMSKRQWESLCDGCGRCCLVKLEDEDTGAIETTDVACRLLELGTCRCGDYHHRKQRVPDCVKLTPGNVAELAWMPRTCAYRLISEGRDLFDWHPLVSGDPDSVRKAGISLHGKVVSERDVTDEELLDHIVDWDF